MSKLPQSANGVVLQVTTRAGHTFNLVAAWAAPYFVYEEQGEGPNGQEPPPWLYHAESLHDARRFARLGGEILNADFSKYTNK